MFIYLLPHAQEVATAPGARLAYLYCGCVLPVIVRHPLRPLRAGFRYTPHTPKRRAGESR
jgi:hypothetical protein